MSSSCARWGRTASTSRERGTTSSSTDSRWKYARSDRSRRNGPLRRRFRDLRRRITAPLVPFLAPLVFKACAKSWRVSFERADLRDEVLRSPNGCIAVLWHGRMATAAPVFGGDPVTVLVSASGDGDMAEMLLERLGYGTLRGSTGKAGVRAMRRMRELLDGGTAIAITPDGPRGPRHDVNRGAAFLARETGRRILPIGFSVGRAIRLGSWDRFTIPLPFSRVRVVMHEPIDPPGPGDEALVETSARIRAALLDAETRGFAALGRDVDW